MINKSIYTSRIKKIAEYVKKGSIVAEIGADHGYITKYLFLTKKIKFAFVTDISQKSLSKAVKNLSNFQNKTCFLVGDGLQVFEKNKQEEIPNQIIIAGMGGKEIIKILSKNVSNYQNFVLQPQKNVLELRNFLIANNYKILKDEVVKQDKMYYFVLKAKKSQTKQKLTQDEFLFGLTNLKTYSPDFLSFLNFEKQKNEQILQKKFIKDINNYQIRINKILNKREKILNV